MPTAETGQEAFGLEATEAMTEQAPQSNGHRREGGGEREGGQRRRRRRGGRGRGRGGEPRDAQFTRDTVPEHAIVHEDHNGGGEDEGLAAEPHGQDAPPVRSDTRDDVSGEGGRRRRRGRRGGRRNRHGRNGEAPFAGEASLAENAGTINEAPPPEPTLRHAVEDLDRPPSQFADERPPLEQLSPTFEQHLEPPRRRSTIREPASLGASAAPSIPQATPVVSSTASEEPAAPKRGWWGRRLLGDKS